MNKPLTPKPSFVNGKFRHYKGNEYEVVDLVRHSETEEWMVLYRPLYGEGDLWVRPFEMFYSNVVIEGVEQPRFAKISEV